MLRDTSAVDLPRSLVLVTPLVVLRCANVRQSVLRVLNQCIVPDVICQRVHACGGLGAGCSGKGASCTLNPVDDVVFEHKRFILLLGGKLGHDAYCLNQQVVYVHEAVEIGNNDDLVWRYMLLNGRLERRVLPLTVDARLQERNEGGTPAHRAKRVATQYPFVDGEHLRFRLLEAHQHTQVYRPQPTTCR